MFNSNLNSDDIEVYESSSSVSLISLSDSCKSNILFYNANQSAFSTLELPRNSFIGKVINIHAFNGSSTGPNGKTANISTGVQIKNGTTIIYTLKSGTASFLYVGHKLSGITANDRSLNGWMIIGSAQGGIPTTGYPSSVNLGSNASSTGIGATSVGSDATSTATASTSFGYGANATSTYSTSMGSGASCSASYCTSLGTNTLASIIYGTAIGYNSTSKTSKIAFKSNAIFASSDDSQAGKFILMRQTTDATPTVITATNAAASVSNILTLPNNGTYAFKGIVVAKDATTLDSAMWEVTALMKRGANASTTALVGTPTITKVFNDTGAAAWTIALTADTTNGGGAITVIGEAAKTIRWVCNIDSAEVI